MKNIIFIIVISVLLTACSKENISNSNKAATSPTTKKEYHPNKDIEPLNQEQLSISDVDGILSEKDYNNISVSMEQNVYSKDTSEIRCIISDKNLGTGFYFYDIPLVEYKQNESWIRLPYYTPDLEQGLDISHWAYCCEETNSKRENSSYISFYPEYLKVDFVDGMYRLKIFAGDKSFYAEFEVR